jgi:ligand-binding sensor domain-containing protein
MYRMLYQFLKISLLAMLYACISISNSFAQTIVSRHYSVNDGLPSSECYTVMQDSKGFLWIATDAGIVKYDGYQFKTYNSTQGLPDNTVFKIHEDRHGRIWFSSYSGQFAYYKHETDSIYTILANKALGALVKYLPIDFAFDDKDTLWVSVQLDGYLKIIPPYYKTFKHYHIEENSIYVKECNHHAFIYGVERPPLIRKNMGVTFKYSFINASNQLRATYMSSSENLSNRLSATQIEPHSYLLADAFKVYNMSEDKVSLVSNLKLNPLTNIINVFKDSKDRIWLSTNKEGVILYNNSKFENKVNQFLQNDIVTCTFEDSDHGFWITTTNNGLYHIPSLNFNYFNKSNGLSADKVYNIALINDKLYCTTDNDKLNILDLKKNTFTYQSEMIYHQVFGFNQQLLVNTDCSRIKNLDKLTTIELKSEVDNKNISLVKILEIDDANLLGFDQGSNIYTVNRLNGMCKLIYKLPTKMFSLFYENQKMLIGTKQGLYQLKDNHLSFLGDTIPLLSKRVEAIASANGMLFIATKGFGVLCYKDSKIVQHFNEMNGLASDICKCIFKDRKNNIWVGTNRGISRLSFSSITSQYKCNTLNVLNGLVSNEINQILEYKNHLYFATNSGIGAFEINTIDNNSKVIPVQIEHFFVNNKKVNIALPLELNYNENYINVQYKGLNLKNKGDITYKYKLQGLDTGWTYSKNTFVQYTTLPDGDFQFIVYALSENDKQSEQAASVSFSIKKPFWKTWWFYSILIATITSVIAIVYNIRVKGIKKMEAQKTLDNIKIGASELKALRAQMNPHFIFNAINSIQSFVIKNESVEAQKYLTKFSKLIRLVLESSKQELVLLSREIEALNLYLELEALRASFSFDYQIDIDNNLQQKTIFIPTMLLQPFVENAILHGLLPLIDRRAMLKISFELKDPYLLIKIEDNGIGRAKAEAIKSKKGLGQYSMGMSVVNERVEMLNKFTSVQTKIDILDGQKDDLVFGTIVMFEIKI